MAEGMQRRLQSELEKFRKVQKDLEKTMLLTQKLDAQLNENKLVKKELDMLGGNGGVYKKVGPVLVKQPLTQAQSIVQTRIDYLTGEMKKCDGALKELGRRQEGLKEVLGKLQHQFQQMKVKAAAKA